MLSTRKANRLSGLPVLVAALLIPAVLHAQATPLPSAAPQRAPLEWDTVSIHQHKPDDPNWNAGDQPNGVHFEGVTVSGLLSEAYGFSIMELAPEDIVGLPEWARKEHYDIMARVSPRTPQLTRS